MSPLCISQNWPLPASFPGLKALTELIIELLGGLGHLPDISSTGVNTFYHVQKTTGNEAERLVLSEKYRWWHFLSANHEVFLKQLAVMQ